MGGGLSLKMAVIATVTCRGEPGGLACELYRGRLMDRVRLRE